MSMPSCASVSAMRMRAIYDRGTAQAARLGARRGGAPNSRERLFEGIESALHVFLRHEAHVPEADDLAAQRALPAGEHDAELGARGADELAAIDTLGDRHRRHRVRAKAVL